MDYARKYKKFRGIRNNNPLNIRKGIAWDGLSKEQPDQSFCSFIKPEWGIRAARRILRTYANKYKLRTISDILHRYAPTVENPTEDYINFVASKSGINKDAVLVNADYVAVLTAMIEFENGVQPYPQDVIRRGVKLGE